MSDQSGSIQKATRSSPKSLERFQTRWRLLVLVCRNCLMGVNGLKMVVILLGAPMSRCLRCSESLFETRSGCSLELRGMNAFLCPLKELMYSIGNSMIEKH